MPKIELGPTGVVLNPEPTGAYVQTAVLSEELGYSTIWLTGGPMESLAQVAAVVSATRSARVATGIIPVDRFPAVDVLDLYSSLEAEHPGALRGGLGGAHGADPLRTLNNYLDAIDRVIPDSRRVLAALGPKMFDLAGHRAAAAFPVLVTPEYVTRMRAQLGADTTLAVEQLVVLSVDPDRARAAARMPLSFLGTVPAYQANFRRMGLGEDDIADISDRLVDALVVWGEVDAIAARVEALRDAGADHVAISVITGDDAQPTDALRELAAALITA